MIALPMNRFRQRRPGGSHLLLAVLLGCSSMPSPRHGGDHELQQMTESRALAVVREVIADVGLASDQAMTVQTRSGPLAIDVPVLPGIHGIEWASAQDRVDHADVLPEPAPEGQLRILPGSGADAERRVLILDASTYRYDADRVRVQHGAVGLSETEGRLRRDVRDFLEYIRR